MKDTSKVVKMHELVRDSSNKDMEHRLYRVSITETEDKIVERFLTEGKYLYKCEFGDHKIGDTFKHYSTSTQQKFLCVNGPLQGTKVTEEGAAKEEYVLFNNSNSKYYQKNKNLPRVVLVHFPKV